MRGEIREGDMFKDGVNERVGAGGNNAGQENK